MDMGSFGILANKYNTIVGFLAFMPDEHLTEWNLKEIGVTLTKKCFKKLLPCSINISVHRCSMLCQHIGHLCMNFDVSCFLCPFFAPFLSISTKRTYIAYPCDLILFI